MTRSVARSVRERFEDDPSLFLENAIKQYVTDNPSNRLQSFDGEPIFDEPLVGFADGDDPIFQEYKAINATNGFSPMISTRLGKGSRFVRSS